MDKGGDFCPVARRLVLDERAVNVESGVAFDADVTTIGLPIHDDGLHDPAVLQDRIAQLFRGRSSLSLVGAATAGDIERESNLLVGGLPDVDFEEAPDAWVRPVKLDLIYGQHHEFPGTHCASPLVAVMC